VQHVSDAVDDATSKVASAAADVKSHVTTTGGLIAAIIERNPLMTILISLNFGMALGRVSHSRH
jgi:hypothetical protein